MVISEIFRSTVHFGVLTVLTASLKHTHLMVRSNWARKRPKSDLTNPFGFSIQGGAPQLCLLVYNPINYRYITNKNHSYWSYVHQLSYLRGPTLYDLKKS